jgi:uncharacterized protein
MVEISRKYLELAKEIILDQLDDPNVKVFLFGSRAGNRPGSGSDIDVGFAGFQKPSETTFRRINLALEESRIPYQIDLVDFDKVSEDFKATALKKIIKWN